jgi:hypothetical protein
VGARSLDEVRDLVLGFVPAVLLIPTLPTPVLALTLAELPLVPIDDTPPLTALAALLLAPIEETPDIIELLLIPNRELPPMLPVPVLMPMPGRELSPTP